ncbi:GNAT family N-acetyltransferase [Subsaxibacter sp. CAU 1640]|uniref:GNAT family N-acetyltransferase n=1 Tax=Subsaxibacter sp. CAU 1640 TaxID=2933271 RepID=UPI002002B932|nr:GNAT family N-acetyltransferase [Subsaxibacter sp. CAU 1640]MCK7591495.1 GNAT family N-acetyltransferase [Subsaxibacter sp. CAU 1640]
MDLNIRQATLEDIPYITSIFRDTIIHINSRDYSDKQVNVWATGANDVEKWTERIKNAYFIVAEHKDDIVGFAYLTKGYYFDGLFIHKDFQRRGIATHLMRIIESQVIDNGYEVIKSDVSITALPFFENQYYDVEKKQIKNIKGINFENYLVSKQL